MTTTSTSAIDNNDDKAIDSSIEDLVRVVKQMLNKVVQEVEVKGLERGPKGGESN